ncbi:MAG: hypothetical protein ACREBT_02975 [Thermoplasmata archaeon]
MGEITGEMDELSGACEGDGLGPTTSEDPNTLTVPVSAVTWLEVDPCPAAEGEIAPVSDVVLTGAVGEAKTAVGAIIRAAISVAQATSRSDRGFMVGPTLARTPN